MNIKNKLFQEIKSYSREQLKPSDYFVCVYGSYASGDHTDVSDLDMFIATRDYNEKDFKNIFNFFNNLHVRYGLKMDDEVPYKNKLLVSYEDVQNAIALRSFVTKNDRYQVPAIEKSERFLASPEVRWRLILNALTSPHEYICGDKETYTTLKIDAEKSLVRLARSLSSVKDSTIDELFKILVIGSNGEEGEMYLGYKTERERVMEYLQKLILRNY